MNDNSTNPQAPKPAKPTLFPINQNERAKLDKVAHLLARDVFERIEKLLDHGIKRFINIAPGSEFDEHRTHDAILLHGERGTGKSTILINLGLFFDANNTLKEKLLVLKPIDFTLLEGHDSLFLNIVVASLVGNAEVKKKLANGGPEADRFHDQLEKLGRALEGVQRQDGQYGLEKIRSLIGSVGMAEQAHQLFAAALKLTGKQIVVMPIDDVDTALEFAFDQIEVVRRYLVSPYVIPIISGDLDLYHEVIWRDFLGHLCTHSKSKAKTARERCKQLSLEYLAKVLPLPRRIEVPALSSYLKNENVMLSDENDNALLSFPFFRTWLDILLNGRVNGVGGSAFPFPIQSIRGFTQLVTNTAELIPELANIINKLNVELAGLAALGDSPSPDLHIYMVRKIINANNKDLYAELVIKWQDTLLRIFKHHPKGRAAYLVFEANRHFREIFNSKPNKSRLVFETDLFNPKAHDEYTQFHLAEGVTLDWQKQLQENLPAVWIDNLPNESVLSYPTPEIGLLIGNIDQIIGIIDGTSAQKFIWQLIKFNTYNTPDKRSTVIMSGRIFEIIILSLIRDVNSTDISALIARPPFYSAEGVVSGNALDLTQYGSAASEGSESIVNLANKINIWRGEKKLNTFMPPHAWLVFKLFKKYFSQFPTNQHSLLPVEMPFSINVGGEAMRIFNYIWATLGGLEKSDIFCLDNSDLIQYHDSNVLGYARFAARLDPSLLVGWRLAERIALKSTLSTHDLQRLVKAQQPFFAPTTVRGVAMAENHVHPNGAYYSGMVLMNGILPFDNRGDIAKKFEKLSLLARGLLQHGSLLPESPNEQNVAQESLADRISNVVQSSIGQRAVSNAPGAMSWQWLAEQQEDAKPDNPRWLRQQIARSMVVEDIDQAWIWFLIWLWVHYQHPNCDLRLRMAIFYLLNSLMHIRRRLIMDGLGLTRFVGYFQERLRQPDGDIFAISAANTIFQGADDVAELKVGSNRMTSAQICNWLSQFARQTGIGAPPVFRPMPPQDVERYRKSMERWHYCVHFFRTEEFCNSQKLVWDHAFKLQTQIESDSGWDRTELLAHLDAQSLRLAPSRWLRGLDVAGDENLVKIEIYAPALRWLRNGQHKKNFREPATQGLHLSIHAGEDYAHPLSGLRHIDETVTFCEMRAGDRLGHALALGISPAEWVALHGEIVLPVDEHLDNLVWAWHYASIMSSRLDLAARVLPILERRISKMIKYVPWTHGGCISISAGETGNTKGNETSSLRQCLSGENMRKLTPEILYRAWKLRRNCFHMLNAREQSTAVDRDQIRIALPDWADLKPIESRNPNGETSPEVMLYRQRWRWLKDHQPRPNERRHHAGKTEAPETGCIFTYPLRKVRIHLQANLHAEFDDLAKYDAELYLIDDSHSPQELEFIEALQDWLLDAYDQKGLMIEANPTSNVYTGHLNDYAKHPIFRWYPPTQDWLKPGEKYNRFGLRRGAIKVCVNTDDPGVMPTTLRTEFALLREAALQHGITRTDADRWLATLREFGLQEFQQKHQAVWVPKTETR